MIALALRMARAITPTGWLVILALLLALTTLGTCQALKSSRGDARRAEAGQTLADARTAAGGDAGAIRDRSDERTAETQALVKEAQDEIRNAPDAASRNRAALVGLCRIDPSASPDCRMFHYNSE